MQTVRTLTAFALALALALGTPGIVAAQTHSHDGSGEAAIEVTLNNAAKWQGDQNMTTGMTAIPGTRAANLEIVIGGERCGHGNVCHSRSPDIRT